MFNTSDSVPRSEAGGIGGRTFKYKPSPIQELAKKLMKKKRLHRLEAQLDKIILLKNR